MVVPIFGIWGMLKDNVHFASTVIVATPCWKFKTQHGLFSSHLFTFLLIVLCRQISKFLGVQEKIIFVRKIFFIPEYFFVFWVLLVFT